MENDNLHDYLNFNDLQPNDIEVASSRDDDSLKIRVPTREKIKCLFLKIVTMLKLIFLIVRSVERFEFDPRPRTSPQSLRVNRASLEQISFQASIARVDFSHTILPCFFPFYAVWNYSAKV